VTDCEFAPTNQPDVYRTLSAQGNVIGVTGDVFIIGTNWADEVIVEKFELAGADLIKGVKPFKGVTKIIVPARTQSGQKVKVGTTNHLGLYYPLSADSDVIQWTKKASADTSYTVQTLTNLNVDDVYATVEPTAGITDDDSFEWVVLTSP
jgi:hypothetical protein